jgi:hypothetical protein
MSGSEILSPQLWLGGLSMASQSAIHRNKDRCSSKSSIHQAVYVLGELSISTSNTLTDAKLVARVTSAAKALLFEIMSSFSLTADDNTM